MPLEEQRASSASAKQESPAPARRSADIGPVERKHKSSATSASSKSRAPQAALGSVPKLTSSCSEEQEPVEPHTGRPAEEHTRLLAETRNQPIPSQPGVQPINAAEQLELEGGESFLKRAYNLRLQTIKGGRPFPPSGIYCPCREQYVPAILKELEKKGFELPPRVVPKPAGDENWDSYRIPPLKSTEFLRKESEREPGTVQNLGAEAAEERTHTISSKRKPESPWYDESVESDSYRRAPVISERRKSRTPIRTTRGHRRKGQGLAQDRARCLSDRASS